MIDFILKYRTRVQQNRNDRVKKLIPYEDIHDVALLFDACDYYKMPPIIYALEREGKRVRAWSYSSREIADFECTLRLSMLNMKSLNFWFMPKKHIVNDFVNYPAQLLLDVSQVYNPVLEYLSVCSKAPFKAGFKAEDPRRYDLVYDIRKTQGIIEENVSHLLFYLKNLREK